MPYQRLLCLALVVAACTPPTLPPPTATPTAPPPSATTVPTATVAPPTLAPTNPAPATLVPPPPEGLRLFPGPAHYEGDVLSLQWNTKSFLSDFGPFAAQVRVDGGEPKKMEALAGLAPFSNFKQLVILNLFDTAGQAGTHTLQVAIQGQNAVTFEVEVLPASERPPQEVAAKWETRVSECCLIHYLSGTAAARDIESIVAEAEAGVAHVETVFNEPLENKPFTITFLDNIWGNSGYANAAGIVIDYTDRDYNNPAEYVGTVIRHEVTHAVARQLAANESVPGFFGEGLAVYVAGGHYRPEPLPERAAALIDLGLYVPLTTLVTDIGGLQHEQLYLQSAAFVAFLVDRYSWEGLAQFMSTSFGEEFLPPDAWLAQALEQNFGRSLLETEADFKAWLLAHPPGPQVDDLRISLALHRTRRLYQQQAAPYFSLYYFEDLPKLPQPGYLIREPRSVENVALELMLVNAQKALNIGAYAEAEKLIEAVQAVLADGNLAFAPDDDYYALAALLLENGYEPTQVQFTGVTAEVTVTRNPPELETITLTQNNGAWQITP